MLVHDSAVERTLPFATNVALQVFLYSLSDGFRSLANVEVAGNPSSCWPKTTRGEFDDVQ